MANDKVYTDYLMHGRTKGSRNGISTTKGYTAIGQRAKGRWVNGHYVYYEDEARNRAFQQGKAETAGRNSAYENQAMIKRMENARKSDVLDQKIYGKKKEGYTRLADISPYERQRLANKYLENNPQHQTAVNQHNANVSGMNAAYERQKSINKATKEANAFNRMKKLSSEKHARDLANDIHNANVSGMNAAYKYAKKQAKRKEFDAAAKENALRDKARAISKKGASNNWQQQANAAASGKPSGYSNAHYNAVSQAAAERNAKEAALARQKKASMQNAGKKNNWQQTANKTAGILGNMSREDRSLMKSHETRYHDKNGKLHINGGFNVNNKYGYSNYTKDDKGWHDVHFGEYNTTGVKGVKKQQDWNTSFERNHRSDIGNAIADAKEDATKAFKEAKADAKQAFVNLKSKIKKKKKK